MKSKWIYFVALLFVATACNEDDNPVDYPMAIDDRSYSVTGVDKGYEAVVGSFLAPTGKSIEDLKGMENFAYQLTVKEKNEAELKAVHMDAKWYFIGDGKVDIFLYTPYKSGIEKANLPIDVINQSESKAIDLLCAHVSGVQQKDDITFNFFHALSRLKLNISIGDDFEESRSNEELLEGLEVSVDGYYTQADYLLAKDEIKNYREMKKINMVMAEDGRVAEAILLPTEPMAEAQLVLKLKEPETLFYYTINDLQLLPTKEVVLDVMLKRNEVVFKEMRINDWLVVEQGSGAAE